MRTGLSQDIYNDKMARKIVHKSWGDGWPGTLERTNWKYDEVDLSIADGPWPFPCLITRWEN